MKKIDKTSMKKIDDAKSSLVDIAAKAAAVVASMNEQLERLSDEANEARQEIYDVLDDVVTQASDYYDERSEKWQEGDAGSAYQDWINTIESARDAFGDDLDLTIKEDVDDFADMLDGIGDDFPSSPGEY